MRPPAHAIVAMPRSGIREVMEIATRRGDALHLEIGEPDFQTPPHVVEAAARAIADGFTKYTLNRGLVSLREALAAKLAAANGIDVTAEDVVVTTGGITGLYESLLAVVEPGEAILVPDPGWPNYEMIACALGAEVVRYPLDPEAGYEPDLERLSELARRPGAKALVVNSPGNPTGAVWSRGMVERVVEIARAADLYLVSDEVYEEIVFEGEHVSPASLDPDGRVLSVFSFSKTYAMTGWRVGYVAAAPEIADLVAKIQEPLISCATAFAQKAAEVALTGPQDCVAEMRDAYRSRRDLAVARLREAGLLVNEPHGAFYVFADIGRATAETYPFARWLVAEHGVAVAPGETFGPGGRGLVRLSLAAPPAVLEAGIDRLAAAVDAYPAGLAADVQSTS
ncbi:MAG: pyridoxal phosphate-dependent aminotransferase [Gaiellaceae bacterium]